MIDHTPKDELLRVYTGDAFDIVGERKQTNFQLDNSKHTVDESFTITLRNHKAESADIRVTERLYRWANWTLTAKSDPFTKTDSQKIEFQVRVPANSERVVSYTVHYSW